jgi:hypothetical protein
MHMTTETVDREALQRIQSMIKDVLDGKGLPPKNPTPAPGKGPGLLSVPYRSQLGSGADKYSNDCGAAAGSMLVEAFTGTNISVTKFYERTGLRSDQYLSATQIIKVLDQLGVPCRWIKNLDLHELFDHLYDNRPVIALINYQVVRQAVKTERSFSGPHFAPVVGMDTKYVYIHDPLWTGTGGQGLAVPIRTFRAAWEATPGNSGISYAAIVPSIALGDKTSDPFRVRVTAYILNVRKGPGTNHPLNGNGLLYREVVTVVETQGDWGRIGPQHWIHLGYTEKL